jgi:hypothetical protein
VSGRLQCIRAAAGARYDRLERHALVQRVEVPDHRRIAAEDLAHRWTQLNSADILESSYVLWGPSSRSWRISSGAGNAGGFPPTCSLSVIWRPLPPSWPVWRANRDPVAMRVARVVVSTRTGEVSGHGPGGVT